MGLSLTAAGSVSAKAAPADAIAARIEKAQSDGSARLVLKGGTIVSLDPKIGTVPKGDLLIRGGKIEAVGGDLNAAGEVIDATDRILIPGFFDCHRHAWEAQLRQAIPDGDHAAYSALTHAKFAKLYRPQDMYVGNFLTALGCLDSGITCLIDNSHNSRTSQHSDQAIRALFDSGIRAVHASAPPSQGPWDHQWPQDLVRLRQTYFSSEDQLVTLGMACGGRFSQDLYALARELDLRITHEAAGADVARRIVEFEKLGLAGPDIVYNHCVALTDEAWNAIRNSGGTVNVCARSDTQYGIGIGSFGLQDALDHGMAPGFSIDNETSYGTDMFSEMRVAFHLQRALAYAKAPKNAALVTVAEILKCATLNGAVCAGLSRKCGTLTPGKEADIVLIRTDTANLHPVNNPIGAVVSAADRGNVDTVFVAGKLRKHAGRLVGLDWERVRKMIDESHNHLAGRGGLP